MNLGKMEGPRASPGLFLQTDIVGEVQPCSRGAVKEEGLSSSKPYTNATREEGLQITELAVLKSSEVLTPSCIFYVLGRTKRC